MMKAFGSKGATASHESYKKGNQPSPELQGREEARCYAHPALVAARTAGEEHGFPDAHLKANHNDFPKHVRTEFAL